MSAQLNDPVDDGCMHALVAELMSGATVAALGLVDAQVMLNEVARLLMHVEVSAPAGRVSTHVELNSLQAPVQLPPDADGTHIRPAPPQSASPDGHARM